MSATVTLTQSQIFVALKAVMGSMGLTAANPEQSVPIIRGQVNRVPEPSGQDFVVLWPLNRPRLGMNVDTWQDTMIEGSIAGNVLTVISVANGIAAAGQSLYGAGVTPGAQIVRQIDGTPGGAGTYATTPTAPVAGGPLYSGTVQALQATEVTIQADVHGPASADNAARIATLFRDQFAVTAFLTQPVLLTPLYTSDPIQMPFDNGEQQVEERWVVDLTMQAEVGIVTTQQFADQLEAATTPVETLS